MLKTRKSPNLSGKLFNTCGLNLQELYLISANFDEVFISPKPLTLQTDLQYKMSHPLVRLSSLRHWDEIERSFGTPSLQADGVLH